MTLRLTPEQSLRWDEGGFSAWRVEEDIIEWCDEHNIQEQVVVELDTGEVLFAS